MIYKTLSYVVLFIGSLFMLSSCQDTATAHEEGCWRAARNSYMSAGIHDPGATIDRSDKLFQACMEMTVR